MASVTVTHVPGTTYQTRIETPDLALIADESEADGGDGLGPSPYELLLAGLGHCTVLTILLYARRKGWPIATVAARLTHERLIVEGDGETEPARRKVERITQEIGLEGDLRAEQRARLLEIAGKCPVHRTMTGELEIVDVEVPLARIEGSRVEH
jgi:putative redox protein